MQDNLQYIYTNLAPDQCHYVFPCFDQPDLKGTFTLSVVCEAKWKVIANEHDCVDENERTERSQRFNSHIKTILNVFGQEAMTLYCGMNDPMMWIFRQSDRISTYLFAMVAGPFESFEDSSEDGLPNLRIFARTSLI